VRRSRTDLRARVNGDLPLEFADVAPTPSIKRGTAHLCIADPLGLTIDNRVGWWANLWATHPPMSRRIAALKAMAFQPFVPSAGR
jgi:Zn-dependent protease with chaperone function